MKLLALLGSVLLSAYIHALKVKSNPSPTIFFEDRIQYNLTELFSGIGSGLTCTLPKDTKARILNPGIDGKGTYLATKSLADYHFTEQPHVVEMLTNNSVYAIFDHQQLVVQNITVDGRAFGPVHLTHFAKFGVSVKCLDMIFNEKTNRIYIGCQTVFDPKKIGSFYIVEYDLVADKVVKSTTIPQQNSFQIKHRLQLAIGPIDLGTHTDTFVIAYDQGAASGGGTNDNKWIHLFSNADKGDLKSEGYLSLPSKTIGGSGFISVFDYFTVQGGILVSGKQNSTSPYAFGFCNIIVGGGKYQFQCNEHKKVTAPFGSTNGYFGIMNTGQIVEVKSPNKLGQNGHIAVCNIVGKFGINTFIDPLCSFVDTKTAQSPSGFIAAVEGNVHQLVVKFVLADGTYNGYTWHSFDLNRDDAHFEPGNTPGVAVLGKNLIVVSETNMGIIRQVPSFVYFNAGDLGNKTDTYKITVNCTDDNTPLVVSSLISARVLHNIYDDVTGNTTALANLLVYEGDTFYHKLDHENAIGNALEMHVSFAGNDRDSDYSNYTQSQLLRNTRISVNYIFQEDGGSNPKFARFKGSTAVTLDEAGVISFHKCFMAKLQQVDCVEIANVKNINAAILKEDINHVFDWTFVWVITHDTESTYAFIFDGTKVHQHSFKGIADDCLLIQQGEYASLVLAYQNEGVVKGFKLNSQNPEAKAPLLDLTVELSGREHFCPVDVMYDPADENVLEVYSNCPDVDQRVLRYTYPATKHPKTNVTGFALRSDIPISFHHKYVQVCTMKTEIVIFAANDKGTAYLASFSKYNDLNQWTFGTQFDQLNLGDAIRFSCLSHESAFSVVSYNKTSKSNYKITTYLGDNQNQANNRIQTVSTQNIDKYHNVDTYEFFGNAIHVLSGLVNLKEHHYLFTWVRHSFLQLTTFKGLVEKLNGKPLPMTVTYRSGASKMPVRHVYNIGVISPDFETKTETFKKIGLESDGKPTSIELEDYVRFKGPITDVHLEGVSHTDINLDGRLVNIGDFSPSDPADQMTYDLLRTASNSATTVGLHRNKNTNNSVLTTFLHFRQFQGHYSSDKPIHAFGIADAPQDTVFVAFSTAVASGQHLRFKVINGTECIADGVAQEAFPEDFDEIKVVPLGFHKATTAYLVAGKNRRESGLHVYVVTYTYNNTEATKFTIEALDNIPNVQDFAVVKPNKGHAFILYVSTKDLKDIKMETYNQDGVKQSQKINIEYTSLVKNHLASQPDFSKIVPNKEYTPEYNIQGIEAHHNGADGFFVIIDTEAPLIFEFSYPKAEGDMPAPEVYHYFKPAGELTGDIHVNVQDFAIRTFDEVFYTSESYAVFYRRQEIGGSEYSFWAQQKDYSSSFDLATCQQNNSHVQWGTSFPTLPLTFLRLQPMHLDIYNKDAISRAKFVIAGSIKGNIAPKSITLAEVIKEGDNINPDDDGSGPSFWPFALILIGLLLISIIFIVYKTKKSDGEELYETENYVSLKPEGENEAAPPAEA